MELSIERLKLAREIGATHVNKYQPVGLYRNISVNGYQFWNPIASIWGMSEKTSPAVTSMFKQIDFTPLDDYYADKNIDIAATSGEEMEIPDGWYRCDEEGKIKPMKPYKALGAKHDKGKPRPSLLPPVAITEMAKVMTFGAEKYEAHGWRKVENAQERYLDALLRHAIAYVGGERTDPESGLPTMAHVMCNAAFLIELDKQQEQTK